MTNLFDDLEQSLLRTYNTSPKQSLEDIGYDEEEKDKIIFNVSSSVNISNLDVDYSSFSNHISFGSAYAAANFALVRIQEYPLDGELKEKNNWRKQNTGYENWFFENYPKQQGYLYCSSGSLSSPYAVYNDLRGIISPNSGNVMGSYCVEFIIQPKSLLSNNETFGIYSYLNLTNKGHYAYLTQESNIKKIVFKTIDEDGNGPTVAATYDNYISSSHAISYTWNHLSKTGSIYIDGIYVTSSFVSNSLVSSSLSASVLKVGTAVGLNFSGNIDEFRIWNSLQARNPELIRRNYFKTIHANHSGGLKVYYKFNEPTEYGNKIIDYSGFENHASLTGNYSISTQIVSGTLGSWFKDFGDPILSLNNSRVNSFITEQRLSGSDYDDENPNMIYNLVPEKFIEGDDTQYQQLFLLLTARHFDRLKLYVKHISNVLKLKTEQYEKTPSNLLDLAAKHYGLNIGDIYSSSDALQYYFGENVLSSGSIDSSLETVKNTLKRNILSNLIYILKTKTTQESIKSALRSIGLDDNIVSISEYTDFSGGIKNTFTPKTVERKVLYLSRATARVNITSSAHQPQGMAMYQFRVLFNTGSTFLTQSLFSLEDTVNGDLYLGITAERSNLTSSAGIIRVNAREPAGTYASITSSPGNIFDNSWVNISAHRDRSAANGNFGLYVSAMDRAGVFFSSTPGTGTVTNMSTASQAANMYLGSSGTYEFNGHIHEFRAWKNYTIPTRIKHLENWAYDWELTDLNNPINDWGNLVSYLKLNDFTASVTGGGPIHDYVNGLSGSSYIGLSSSVEFNFPGKYIDKFDIGHSYDLNVDNDKIRIRNSSEININDLNYDLPYVSIDFSPVTSLNKEIMKWVGDLSLFSNITSDPIYDYVDESTSLTQLRSMFFKERVNDKIDFSAFSNLVKWFDNNFSQLISQLIPLDMLSSVSNFVIEPHILEYNKTRKSIGAGGTGRSTNLEASITLTPQLTASSNGYELGLADPGRFGSFVSSSAEITEDVKFNYEATLQTGTLGLNFHRPIERKIIDQVLRNNDERFAPKGYGNGFYHTTITGSNFLKNSLNVVSNFAVSGILYVGAGNVGSLYLSSSHGPPALNFTSTFNGVQDARWLWMKTANDLIDETKFPVYKYDYGIGYGGGWGQLWSRNNKSVIGKPKYPAGSTDGDTRFVFIGENSSVGKTNFSDYISIFDDQNLKTFILWPNLNAYDGVELFMTSSTTSSFLDRQSAARFGDTIKIEEYNTLNLEIIGRTNPFTGSALSATLNFEVKFQFFSKDAGDDTTSFETLMSASRKGDIYEATVVPRKYLFSTIIQSKTVPQNFSFKMERSLPKQRYMRIFLTPHCPNAGDSESSANYGSYFVVVKGVLSSKDKQTEELEVRDI